MQAAATGRLKRALRLGKKFQNPVPTQVGGLGMIPKLLPLYLTNKEERVPKQALGPFFTDPAIYANPPASGMRVTSFGHSAMLLEIDSVRVLIDPVWEERASPVRWAGPKRFFPPTLSLEQLPALDVVLLSHDHYDHLGADTVHTLAGLSAARQARWIAPLAAGAILQGFGVSSGRITELDWTEATTVRSERTGAALEITALPARGIFPVAACATGLRHFGPPTRCAEPHTTCTMARTPATGTASRTSAGSTARST